MATSELPYRNNQDWDELIEEVNAVLENPTGNSCEPIDPIDPVPPRYRWGKSDLREMQEKIEQTCPDIEFDPIPEGYVRWAQHFIDEIRDSLEQAWCECENEGVNCPNCGETTISNIYTDAPKAQVCPTGSSGGCPIEPADVQADVVEFSNLAHEALFQYINATIEVCNLNDQILIKENQIEMKEEEISSLETLVTVSCENGPSANCLSAQAQLAQAQDDLAILEAQRDQLIQDRDDAIELRNTSRADCEANNDEAITLLSTMSIPAMTPSPQNITSIFLSGAGSHPWGDDVEQCEPYGVADCIPQYRFLTSTNSGTSFSLQFQDFYTPGGVAMIPPTTVGLLNFLATWGSVCFTNNPALCPPLTITNTRITRLVYSPPVCDPVI